MHIMKEPNCLILIGIMPLGDKSQISGEVRITVQ